MMSSTLDIDKILSSKKRSDWESEFRTISYVEGRRFFLDICKENKETIAEYRIQTDEHTCSSVFFRPFEKSRGMKEQIRRWVEDETEFLERECSKLKKYRFVPNKWFDGYFLILNGLEIKIQRLADKAYLVMLYEKTGKGNWRLISNIESKEDPLDAVVKLLKENMNWDLFSNLNAELRDLMLKNE